MVVLLSWSGLSLLGGSALAVNGYRDQAIMHTGWAVINAGIATLSILSTKSKDSDWRTYLKNEKTFNQILALNTGLDLAYISTGFLMNQWGKSSRIRNFGSAITIQGSFLLLFDSILLYRSNRRLNEGIRLITNVIQVEHLRMSNQIPAIGVQWTLN